MSDIALKVIGSLPLVCRLGSFLVLGVSPVSYKIWVMVTGGGILSMVLFIFIPPKTAYSCKKSACPSKADLTVTKSDDIIVRPRVRYETCKITDNTMLLLMRNM